MSNKKFYRNRQDKMFLGVFSGIAEYFGWDVSIVRIVAVLIGIFTNVPFLLVYFIVAFCTQER
ncbi:MAG: PspC domain-containing protein [Lachnospirales bacterium]